MDDSTTSGDVTKSGPPMSALASIDSPTVGGLLTVSGMLGLSCAELAEIFRYHARYLLRGRQRGGAATKRGAIVAVLAHGFELANEAAREEEF